MFAIGALLALVQFAHLLWICVAMAPRQGPVAAGAPPPMPPRLGRLAVAALLQVVGIVLAVIAAVVDATERTYQIAWMVLGPATIGLTAFAYALASLGRPRSASGVAEVATTLAFLVGIGVTACYGLMMVG